MKKILFMLFIGVMVLSWINANAAEELTPVKREDIKRLLQATGSMQIAQTMSQAVVNQMSETIKKARPDIPPQMLDVMSEQLHRHHRSEEIYHVTEGEGRMVPGEETFAIRQGDTICIPPGTPHRVENTGKTELRILCCCSPPYSHDDTELLG